MVSTALYLRPKGKSNSSALYRTHDSALQSCGWPLELANVSDVGGRGAGPRRALLVETAGQTDEALGRQEGGHGGRAERVPLIAEGSRRLIIELVHSTCQR